MSTARVEVAQEPALTAVVVACRHFRLPIAYGVAPRRLTGVEAARATLELHHRATGCRCTTRLRRRYGGAR